MLHDVFLSYARPEHELALALHSRLAQVGLSSFVAPLRIGGGTRWRNEIRAGIRGSREFIVLASQASLASEWVRAECGAAWGLDKRITPILVDVPAEALPAWLGEYHSIPLAAFDEWARRSASGRGRVRRFTTGEITDRLVIEVVTGAIAPTTSPVRYAVRRGELHLGDAETVFRLEFAIIGTTGRTTEYLMVGHGPAATGYADLEYQVWEGERLGWGGVMCLRLVAFQDDGECRGYWMANSELLPGHIRMGSILLREGEPTPPP